MKTFKIFKEFIKLIIIRHKAEIIITIIALILATITTILAFTSSRFIVILGIIAIILLILYAILLICVKTYEAINFIKDFWWLAKEEVGK
jgi:hypothetical protein